MAGKKSKNSDGTNQGSSKKHKGNDNDGMGENDDDTIDLTNSQETTNENADNDAKPKADLVFNTNRTVPSPNEHAVFISHDNLNFDGVNVNLEDNNSDDEQEDNPYLRHITPAVLRKYAMVPDEQVLNAFVGDDAKIYTHEQLKESVDHDSTDTIIVGILYNMKHWKKGSSEASNEREKRLITRLGANYNRMAFFATLEGLAFAMIFQTSRSADIVFSHLSNANVINSLQDQIGVGRAFAIIEPHVRSRAELREDMMIVDTDKPLIPLKDEFFDEMIQIDPIIPSSANEERFWFIKGQRFNVSAIKILGKGSSNIVSCQGALCDRQSAPNETLGCGCFNISHNYKQSAMVLKFDILNPFWTHNGLPRVIQEIRSLRTTLVFIKDRANISSLEQRDRYKVEKDLRQRAVIIVNLVNDNGGWDLMGVVRRGLVSETSEQLKGRRATVNKTLGQPTYTPCYFAPRQFTTLMNDVQFNRLRFRYKSSEHQ